MSDRFVCQQLIFGQKMVARSYVPKIFELGPFERTVFPVTQKHSVFFNLGHNKEGFLIPACP